MLRRTEELKAGDIIIVHGRAYTVETVQHRVRLGLKPVKPETPGEHTTLDTCYSTLIEVVDGESKEPSNSPEE